MLFLHGVLSLPLTFGRTLISLVCRLNVIGIDRVLSVITLALCESLDLDSFAVLHLYSLSNELSLSVVFI